MAISKRSLKCWECKHLGDMYAGSPFPISCNNNGLTGGVSLEGTNRADFYRDDVWRIPEDAECPNFEKGESGFMAYMQKNRTETECVELLLAMRGWPQQSVIPLGHELAVE